MTQFRHRLGFDLTNALAGDSVHLADFIECFRLTIGQAKPHADNTRLALGQSVKHGLQLLLKQGEADCIAGNDRFGVLNEITEFAISVFTQRCVQ